MRGHPSKIWVRLRAKKYSIHSMPCEEVGSNDSAEVGNTDLGLKALLLTQLLAAKWDTLANGLQS